jgi:adenosylcobinamide kinase/adenosylcobinamide-phosphate guanylyltransferase
MSQGIAHSELILGGQRSGKSRRAEMLARQWLEADAAHQAVLIATAQPWDEEMQQRIARHQLDRAARVPGMRTVEEPVSLADAISAQTRADTLIVVDCLTLWLTNLRMPSLPEGLAAGLDEQPAAHDAQAEELQITQLLEAIAQSPGPIVVVGNEIGLGVIPMGAQVRSFVDALGRLNQEVARVCHRVTLMAAGLPLTLKGSPCAA